MTDERSAVIHSFFVTIFGDQEGWVVGGLMDRAGPKGQLRVQRDFRYPEHLEDMVEWAETHANEDAYISPLIYGDMKKADGHVRRIPENALTSNVVYQDSDTCTPDKFRLRPSVHVESSAGRYQDYWVLMEPVAAERAANASRKIAIAHRADGSDPSSWSANKFLRIPETTNTRHGFPEVVASSFSGELYDIDEIEGKYEDIAFEERPLMRLPEDQSYDDVQDLPEYASALAKLPGSFKMTLITDQPSPSQDRSTLRYRLLCDLFRVEGLTFEDVLAIAWHAPASSKWREDSRNLRGLIGEAIKAQADVAYRAGEGFVQISADDIRTEPEKIERESLALLSDDERALVSNERNFITRYETFSREKLGAAFNAPYSRMNAWSTLAAVFGDFGYVPDTEDALNFFMIGLGGSGSGKSASRRVWKRTMGELLEHDQGWMLGSDASPVALHEKLIERDGKISFFSADEAHGWFKATNSQQWADGIFEKITEYYNGDVPPMLRVSQGRRETSGKSAKTYFNIHFMGTLKGELSLPAQLNTAMFHTGFLARMVWFIGDEKEVTRETLRATNGDGRVGGVEQQARQWAAEFDHTKKLLKAKTGKTRVPMMATHAALERLTDFNEQARALAQARPEWEILDPSLVRLSETVRKAASLMALDDGRAEVELRDVLMALVAAEEWLANLFFVASQVSSSMFARECDDIEAFVLSKGGEVLRQAVFTKFKARMLRDLITQLDSLHAQGRVVEADRDGKKVLRAVRGDQ